MRPTAPSSIHRPQHKRPYTHIAIYYRNRTRIGIQNQGKALACESFAEILDVAPPGCEVVRLKDESLELPLVLYVLGNI